MEKHLMLAASYEILYKLLNKYFKLDYPIYLKVSTSRSFCNKFGAMYETKEYHGKMVHEIKLAYIVFNDICYLYEVLTHELCHAEQAEKNIELSHNRAFFSRLDYVLVQQGLPVTSLEYRKAIKKY